MKKSWLVWAILGVVVLTVLISFNYERDNETIPLSEIFPEKDVMTGEVDYEFVDTDGQNSASSLVVQTPPLKSDASGVSVQDSVPVAVVTTAVADSNTTASKTRDASLTSGLLGAAPSSSSGNGKVYTIQVAAFKKKSYADKAVKEAEAKGYSAYVDTHTHKDGTTWYQMCIGKLDSKESAKELLLKVKQGYQDGFIKVLSGN